MQYMVTGVDGKEYGPTDVETLRSWVAENRLAPHTQLRDFNTGQTITASALPGLFPQQDINVPPVGATYPRGGAVATAISSRDHGGDVLGGVIFRCVLSLVLAFVVGGLGLASAAYAMYYAVQCQRSGSKYGILALVLAGVTLALVGTVWAIRLSHRYQAQ